MKKYALLFAFSLSILSCEKKQEGPDPTVEFRIGYLTVKKGAVTTEIYENQDTILRSELDTALSVSVIENNLDIFKLDSLELEDLEFTIYVNTVLDNEKFTNGINVYSISRGVGKNIKSELIEYDNNFILPLRIGNGANNDNKIELTTQRDYIRLSYESLYTGMSKVKTIIIRD